MPVMRSARGLLRELLVIGGILASVFGFLYFIGLSLSPVLTSSMEPAYMPRDLIVTVSPRIVSPEVGDVISGTPRYADGAEQPRTAHRIIRADPRGWMTKGDNNSYEDSWFYPPEAVDGVVIAKIPFWLLATPWLIGSFIFVLAFVIVQPLLENDDETGEVPEELVGAGIGSGDGVGAAVMSQGGAEPAPARVRARRGRPSPRHRKP